MGTCDLPVVGHWNNSWFAPTWPRPWRRLLSAILAYSVSRWLLVFHLWKAVFVAYLECFSIVPCLIVNCHTRSGRDKEKSFCRVPFVIKHREDEVEELSIERLLKWLSAISGVGLTEDILKNDRACCSHFVSGRPAANWDKYNVHWVPSLHQGHDRKGKTDLELQVIIGQGVPTPPSFTNITIGRYRADSVPCYW